MNSAVALTRKSLPVVVLYLGMGISPLLVEPAYIGYLAAYSVFVFLCARQLLATGPGATRYSPMLIGWVTMMIVVMLVTLLAKPGLRDLVRDGGAVASFLFGLFVIPRALGKDWERPLFAALSALAVIVALWTIVGAARAYFAGAEAYEWRGVYVPYANTWLPYLIVAEYIRSRSGADVRVSAARIALCVLALLLSLSRTGIVLIVFFGAVVFLFNARRWLLTGRGLALMVTAAVAGALILPRLWGLDVVQQRVAAGIGSSDLSLGWRAMEQTAMINFLNDGGWRRWLFGFGLGAQLPLPVGIVDFAGNPTIPHLHNSYWTLTLKFGLIGTLWILFNMGVLFLRANLVRAGLPALWVGGSWILILVMGTAVTLHGMSEWSHLTFLGLACAMLSKAGRGGGLSRAGRGRAAMRPSSSWRPQAENEGRRLPGRPLRGAR